MDGPAVVLAHHPALLVLNAASYAVYALLVASVPRIAVAAARSVSAVIVVINSLAIAAFQVRASRGMLSPGAAARGAVLSGACSPHPA